MDKRLKGISSLLSEYSRGSFDKQLSLSDRLDEIDGISGSINMLGEELKAATISRNYFNNIFNAVTDMVLVINTAGVIEEANSAAVLRSEYEAGFLKGKPFNTIKIKGLPHFRKLLAYLRLKQTAQYEYCRLKTKTGAIIPIRVNLACFQDEQLRSRILFTATDISYRIKTENLIIRAIIDIQEKERIRLSKDLHDSIIQQMAGIKFYISTTAGFIKDPEHKQILLRSNTAMAEMITEIRSICFNLMPRTLEEFGIVKAVQVFCDHVMLANKITFDIRQETGWPDLLPALGIDLYRVVQEFVHNAIKHGQAKLITILFSSNRNALMLKLQDNGKGFDVLKASGGMGLKNVQSRIRSHDGKLELVSIPGKGTRYMITIPLN